MFTFKIICLKFKRMRGFIYFTTTLFFITSCGGSGSKPLPTVNLTATPTSVALGNASTFSWTSTNANSCSASWTIQTSTFGTELLIISNLGNNTYSIICNGDGGISSASVTVEGYRETDGVVVDGYISGAEVCIDEDENWTCDSNESSTTSDNEGKFTIRYANGNLVSIGGIDLDSQTLLDNLLITHKLIGHSDFKAVTPVTSIAAFMDDPSQVKTVLGIDSSIDVFTFDPVANKGDGGIYDYLYEKGNQLTVLAYALQNISNNLNTSTETTQDYFKAITEEIEKEYTETETRVDIETEAFVSRALENVITAKSVTIDETAKANTAKALAGVMPIIEVKSSDDLTTGVIRFAVSTLQTDIQAIANGTATAETVSSYTSNVLAYIAEDQNIDADEITPNISAIADSAITSEDTAVTINVVANDSYVTNAPVTVTATNGTNGTTTISESSLEQITYNPDADYNGTDTFSYTITQGDKTSTTDVTVTIEAVNDAPSIDTASTIQVAENQTAVTTFSVSDVDEDELTLTLGGTDADSFNLSNENVLTFKVAPDYETKDSYLIILTLTDGIETVTKDLTIAITNINDVAPEFTSDATFSAAENQTAIGTVTATDAEGDNVSFTVSGSELAITSAGVLTFASAPDYETKTSYTATVTASDGTNSTTQAITVNVTNLNDVAPVFKGGSSYSTEENKKFITIINVYDSEGDSLSFSISGNDAENFYIDSSSGALSFKDTPDFETKNKYILTITVNDGVNSISLNMTINITNVEENSFGDCRFGSCKFGS
jgi:serralysin